MLCLASESEWIQAREIPGFSKSLHLNPYEVKDFLWYVTEHSQALPSGFEIFLRYSMIRHRMMVVIHNGGSQKSIPACEQIFENCIKPHIPNIPCPPYFY